MTLKELATQLNRPMGEVVKSLAKHGFKGIYRNTHTVPAEAVEIVTNDIAGNLTALPSANADDPIEQENITPNQDAKATPTEGIAAPAGETAQETERLLQQTSQAMVATAEHIAVNRNQQAIINAELLGINDAIGSNLAYKRAYSETIQTLAQLDAKAQASLLTELTSKLNNPDFFGSKTSQETYYNSSQDTAKDTAKDLRAMVNNLSY